MSDPGGIDVARVGAWLARDCGLEEPISVRPVAGGRSNLTSVVTDAAGGGAVGAPVGSSTST